MEFAVLLSGQRKGWCQARGNTRRHIYPTLFPEGFAATLQPSWLNRLGPGRNQALKTDGWISGPAQGRGVRRAGGRGGDVALQREPKHEELPALKISWP